MNTNPALVGVFIEDLRFTGVFRQQWSSVPVAYNTFSGSFDTKTDVNLFPNGLLAVGILFNSDEAGDAKLSLNQIALNPSLIYELNDLNQVSIGLQLGISQRKFKTSALQFANQFNGELFDPSQPTGESFDHTNLIYADLSAGMNWHFEKSPRSKIDVGFALFHFNEPSTGFYNSSSVQMASRLMASLSGVFQIHTSIDGIAFGHFNQRLSSKEYLGGLGIRYHLRSDRFNKFYLQPYLAYRLNFNDAIIPGILAGYKQWRIGFSFDINTSDFKIATGGNGGPELSIQYLITKVKPIEGIKVCPVF